MQSIYNNSVIKKRSLLGNKRMFYRHTSCLRVLILFLFHSFNRLAKLQYQALVTESSGKKQMKNQNKQIGA